jgi:hypothetical protein
MSTVTRKRLLAMAGVTAGMAAAVVAPSPAHAAVAPTQGPSGSEPSELQKGFGTPQATGAGTASLGTCRSWTMFINAANPNLVLYIPSLARGGSVDCDLRRGDVTEGVYKLQDAAIRCYGQDLARDGNFGIETHKAVKNIQNFSRQPETGAYSWSLGSVMRWPIYDRNSGQWTGRCFPQ